MGLQGHLHWPAAPAPGPTGSTVPRRARDQREPGCGSVLTRRVAWGKSFPLSGLLSVHSGELPRLRCEGQVVHGVPTSGRGTV